MQFIRLVGSQRRAVEKDIGKYVYQFVLAAYANLYDDSSAPDQCEFTAENGYDTFENLVAPEPQRLKRPITVMRDARVLMASLFASLIDVVDQTGPLPPANVRTHLANQKCRSHGPVLFLIGVAEAYRPLITQGYLDRNFDSISTFRAHFEAKAIRRSSVAPGGAELARVFVDFMKCVAWAAARFAIEHRVTLNKWVTRTIFRTFSAHPEVAPRFDESLMEFFAQELEWIRTNDTSKKRGGRALANKSARDEDVSVPGKPARDETAAAADAASVFGPAAGENASVTGLAGRQTLCENS